MTTLDATYVYDILDDLVIGAEANFVAAGQAAAITEQANWIASGHTGLSPKALQIFGNFTHPLVDSTSPAHEGYQSWGGCTRLSSLIPGIGGSCVSAGGLSHALRESPLAFRGEPASAAPLRASLSGETLPSAGLGGASDGIYESRVRWPRELTNIRKTAGYRDSNKERN